MLTLDGASYHSIYPIHQSGHQKARSFLCPTNAASCDGRCSRLRELMQQAAAADFTEFTLEVRVSNAPAIALYHKLGFHDEGIRKDFYSKPREDAIIMWNSWTRLPLGEVNNL